MQVLQFLFLFLKNDALISYPLKDEKVKFYLTPFCPKTNGPINYNLRTKVVFRICLASWLDKHIAKLIVEPTHGDFQISIIIN